MNAERSTIDEMISEQLKLNHYSMLLDHIRDKTVTAAEFNSLIAENWSQNGKLIDERLKDRITLKTRRATAGPTSQQTSQHNLNPVPNFKSRHPKVHSSGKHVDPTNTVAGRKAAYHEAVEWIKTNHGKQVESIDFQNVNVLHRLVIRLLSESKLNGNWLWEVKQKLEQIRESRIS